MWVCCDHIASWPVPQVCDHPSLPVSQLSRGRLIPSKIQERDTETKETGRLNVHKCNFYFSNFHLSFHQILHVSDLFFAHSSKLGQRKSRLLGQLRSCHQQPLDKFSRTVIKKLETKNVGQALTSVQVDHLQLQADVVNEILEKVGNQVEQKTLGVIERFLSFSSLSRIELVTFAEQVKQIGVNVGVKPVYSFEAGLWKLCEKCSAVIQSDSCDCIK